MPSKFGSCASVYVHIQYLFDVFNSTLLLPAVAKYSSFDVWKRTRQRRVAKSIVSGEWISASNAWLSISILRPLQFVPAEEES